MSELQKWSRGPDEHYFDGVVADFEQSKLSRFSPQVPSDQSEFKELIDQHLRDCAAALGIPKDKLRKTENPN